MKVLILSDIHSNIYALEAIWKQEQDSDMVLCAGDLVDYGPHPREVVAWVRDHDVFCVQGNHDQFVIHCYRNGLTMQTMPKAQRMWAHHNATLLSVEDVRFLENLPKARQFEWDGIGYGLTHLYQDYAEIVTRHAFAQFRAETFAPRPDREIIRLIFGHTHRQGIRYLSDTWLWLNPGSVSYRRADDPDPTAHYITIIDGIIALRGADYDRSKMWGALWSAPVKESERHHAERFL